MSLVEHARRELELVGEDPETIDGIARVVQAFTDYGHSGGSSHYAISYLVRLLRFEPLTPLTDDPEEWVDRSTETGLPNWWQNIRDGRAMSHDGGRTYWLTNEADAAGGSDAAPLHRSEQKGQTCDSTT